jgi:hypothetical protein
MGVDDYRDREGDAEERTGVGQGEGVAEAERDAGGAVSDYRDTEGMPRRAPGWAAARRASTMTSTTAPA